MRFRGGAKRLAGGELTRETLYVRDKRRILGDQPVRLENLRLLTSPLRTESFCSPAELLGHGRERSNRISVRGSGGGLAPHERVADGNAAGGSETTPRAAVHPSAATVDASAPTMIDVEVAPGS
jgi:hypothetical protein